MASLPSTSPTVDAIFGWYENQTRSRRKYLGGSEIGYECRRRLWYGFRWVAKPIFEGRILRLFETGSREEDRIIANLRAVGCTIEGEQHEVVACDGHMRGHFDGVVLGLKESPKTWHLLECKTHNAKQFAKLSSHGVKESHPTHYAQMQFYMGEEGLKRAAYAAQCKDDDRLLVERVKYVGAEHEALVRKGNAIIHASEPPERIGKDASFWQCKFCPFTDNCHGRKIPEVNCRTCVHSEPVQDGKWECARFLEMYRPVCAEHLFIPGLLHWATPVDGSPTHVLYEADGQQFCNCAATGHAGVDVDHYSSRDMFK